jgi:hypothetical protein
VFCVPQHNWRACPFAHPTENARRRDPREFTYSSLVCPDYRQGCCVRGDTCQYAHGKSTKPQAPQGSRVQGAFDPRRVRKQAFMNRSPPAGSLNPVRPVSSHVGCVVCAVMCFSALRPRVHACSPA